MPKLKQFIPKKYCLTCLGCCRYLKKKSPWPVQGIPLIHNPNKHQSNFICSFLNIHSNKCKIYKSRPFECYLYPFLINRKGKKAFLAVDIHCPIVKEKFGSKEFNDYAEYLCKTLQDIDKIAQKYPGVIDIIELK